MSTAWATFLLLPLSNKRTSATKTRKWNKENYVILVGTPTNPTPSSPFLIFAPILFFLVFRRSKESFRFCCKANEMKGRGFKGLSPPLMFHTILLQKLFPYAFEEAFMWIYKEARSPFYGLVLGYTWNYTHTRPSIQWAGHNLPDSLLSVNSPQICLLIWLVCLW